MQGAGKNKSPGREALEAADRLHSAAIHLLRRLRIRDRESGIGPAQLSALSVLVFAGPRSLQELAEAEQVRPPTMSRIVASLRRRRLICREVDPRDRRRVQLAATRKGNKLMLESRNRRVRALASAMQTLTREQREVLSYSAELLSQLNRL